MSFLLVFFKVLVIFLIIIVGYILYKCKLVSPQGRKDITNLLLYVLMPSALIRAYQQPFDSVSFFEGLKITLFMAIIYLIAIGISILIASRMTRDYKKRNIIMMGMVLPNVGFMGYPIIESILGSQYIFYAVMANISFEIISWTIIAKMVAKSANQSDSVSLIKRLMTTPPIVAIFAGLIMYMTPVILPDPFYSVINLLGNAMTPIAMIIVGLSLGDANIKELLVKKELYFICVVRLLLFPIGLISAFHIFSISEGVAYIIPVVLFSMPSAGYTSIIAQKYGSDATYAAEIVTLCNILSLVSIPLVISFM